jgi:hypothetical protein
MSKGAKGSQPSGTTTSTQMPPAYMLPYLSTALQQSNSLLGTPGPQYYPGQTVAGFSSPQQQAMKSIFNMGMGKTGQDGLDAANQFDKMLLNGGGSNPWLDQTFQQAAGASRNQLAGEFAGAGRNTSAAMPLRAEQLNNLATGIYGGAYQNNIQNALAAGNQAQSIYDARMGGLQNALGIGGTVQGQAQKLLDADKAKYDYYQNLPYQQLQQYERMLGGVQSGSQSTNPYFNNPTQDTLSAAQSAMQIYGMGKNLGWWGGSGGSSASNTGADLYSNAKGA